MSIEVPQDKSEQGPRKEDLRAQQLIEMLRPLAFDDPSLPQHHRSSRQNAYLSDEYGKPANISALAEAKALLASGLLDPFVKERIEDLIAGYEEIKKDVEEKITDSEK